MPEGQIKAQVKKQYTNEVKTSCKKTLDFSPFKESMEKIQPELIKDILERGIIFTGGIANFDGFIDYTQKKLEIEINIILL